MSASSIVEQLKGLDLDKLREEALADIRSGKKTRRQKGVKLLRAVDGLQRSGMTPEDLLVHKVPVIPSSFRPYSVTGSTFVPGDANELYSDMIRARNLHKESLAEFGEEGSRETARYLRQAVRAAYGYEDSPNPKIRARRVTGFLGKILGSNPKVSFAQSKLLAKPQDFVGRGVVSPDPDLGMDEIGIPVDMAWNQYRPYIERRLTAQGIPKARMLHMIKDRHPTAEAALRQEMTVRPVLYSRAPAWHRHNFVAAWPKLAEGNNIMTSPYTSAGLALDHDGDSGRFWLPIEIHVDSKDGEAAVASMPHSKIEIKDTRQFSIRIEDIPVVPGSEVELRPGVREHDVQPGVRTLAYHPVTNEVTWSPVTKFSVHDKVELHAITVGKESFLSSTDHSLLAFSKETNRVEKMPPLATRTVNRRECNLMAPVSRNAGSTAGELIDSFPGPFGRDVAATRELGFALGIYVGDGAFSRSDSRQEGWVYALYLYGGGSVSSRRKQKTHMDAALTLWSTFGLNSDKPSYTEYTRESLGGKIGQSGRTVINAGKDQSLMRACHSWLKGLCGDTAESKSFPPFVLDACREFRWGMFCGILASDGHIGLNHGKDKPQLVVGLNSITSAKLASDFLALCRSLNLGSSVSIASRRTSTGKQEFTVSVSTVDLASLWKIQPFSVGCPERDAILAEYLPGVRIGNTEDFLPFPGGELDQVVREAFWNLSGCPKKGTRRNFGASASWHAKGKWHRASAEKWLPGIEGWVKDNRPEMLEELRNYSRIVGDVNIRWDEIHVSDETVVETAYDITVPGPYTFATAGGTFVQDTIAVHTPSLPEAVEDAKNKLMPSKMLFSIRNRDTTLPVPKHEMLLGAFSAQLKPSGKVHAFANQEEALRAYDAGLVNASDQVIFQPNQNGIL